VSSRPLSPPVHPHSRALWARTSAAVAHQQVCQALGLQPSTVSIVLDGCSGGQGKRTDRIGINLHGQGRLQLHV